MDYHVSSTTVTSTSAFSRFGIFTRRHIVHMMSHSQLLVTVKLVYYSSASLCVAFALPMCGMNQVAHVGKPQRHICFSDFID